MIDGHKDSDYTSIMKELCPELESCEPGHLNSKRLPVLKNIITVDSKQNGCYSWDEAIALGEKISLTEVEKLAATYPYQGDIAQERSLLALADGKAQET